MCYYFSDMSNNNQRKKRKYRKSFGTIIGHFFATTGVTLGLLIVFILLVMVILFKGPSAQAKKLFTLSLNETSALKWIPPIFLDGKDYEAIINPTPNTNEYVELPFAPSSEILSMDTETASVNENLPELEIIDIKEGTYKGKLMLVHNPSRVFFGAIDSFGDVGITLSQFLEKYNAVACTNAGGFEDEDGRGKGGIPDGIVIQNGNIVYGSAQMRYIGLGGFDADNVLHVGDMTGSEALAAGIINGTNFSGGPVLIKDGVSLDVSTSGINPRTCIGQTADGTVILLSLEGRLADSLGATFQDLTKIMLDYGAINAVNMDGGSSAGMYYEGERITRSCSVVGDRPLPTAILVSR